MKHVSILALSALTTIGAIPCGAIAAPLSHMHTSGIVVNDIAAMQHSIMVNVFDNFNSSPSLTLERRYDKQSMPVMPADSEVADNYGKMSEYGEYGDDGTVFDSGRSGGDDPYLSNNNWIDWQHAQDSAKFDKFSKIDSRYDLLSVGFANDPYELSYGVAQFGGFGGVMMAHEDGDDLKLSETGEFLGLYNSYHLHGFDVTIAGDIGVLFGEEHSDASGKYNLTNLWAGGALNVSYNIELDEDSIIQPGVFAAYTWIHTDEYKSKTGASLSVDNFKMFEVSPSLRAITHVVNGWYGIMSGRYVFHFADGGNAKIAGVYAPELDLLNYSEYGLSIEKSTDYINVAMSLNRRDGGRTGWAGGIHIRYRF